MPKRVVVDDFGTAVLYRKCSRCLLWKPFNRVGYVPMTLHANGAVQAYHSACRVCHAAKEREWRARWPVERRRERDRKRFVSLRNDPERYRAARARMAASARTDAQRAKQRERKRRARERLMADPVAYEEHKEMRRLATRLRRMRLGLPVGKPRIPRPVETDGPRSAVIPTAQLVDVILREYQRQQAKAVFADDPGMPGAVALEHVAQSLGVDPRTLYRWRCGTGHAVTTFDQADTVLTRLGLRYYDVWSEETTRRPLFRVLRRSWFSAGGSQAKAMRTRATVPVGDAGPDEYALAVVRWKFEGGEKPTDPDGYPYGRRSKGGWRFTGDACACGAPWGGP